jgi:hypothetical protein
LGGFTWMLQVLTPEPGRPEGSTPESEADSNPKRNFTPPQGENLSEDSMKKTFLLIVVPALLVAMVFAQTPAPSINTDQTTIKGCLGGSDGNYTVVEDNTGRIFKITTSSADLKPHLSHDVALIGHKASGVSSAPPDNSFAVTELNMISEHCAAAATASAAAVSTPSETASTPAAGATPPDATVSPLPQTVVAPAAPATAPAETVVAPAAPATPPAETVVAPAAPAAPTAAVVTPDPATPPAETVVKSDAVAAAPVATVSTPSEPASNPEARPRRRPHTPAAATPKPDATVSSSSESASAPAAAATTPAAAVSSAPDPATTPAAVATTPAAASRGWSLYLWIAFAVLIIVIGTTFPFLNRWRKRKSLERTGAPNLSFIREAKPAQVKADQSKGDQSKNDPPAPRKVA